MLTVGDEDIEGGLRKFLDTRKGGSKNLYTSKPTGGRGAPKKIEPLARGTAKIPSFEFQYLHSPLVILNELSLIFGNFFHICLGCVNDCNDLSCF